MKTLTLEELKQQLNNQNVEQLDRALICPMCETVQSARLIMTFDPAARKYLGVECVGRFSGKGSPSIEKGKNHGYNWSLSGLFQMHNLEIITDDGQHHPYFEAASPEQAQELASRLGGSCE
ncbi:TPA: hypothetical protein M4731_001395 [Salmonella enterica]|nr:hypothetical protein [Salmonella enterica]MCH5735386.1 hypothetical protein [Salmonella enterica]MCH5741820.1 hypothetical protein [Salmonella enterica]MCH5746918.1 hypothetical protein [Salmonella enterica]MCH5757100.1 hypothetical protein [Salmonella enterica]